MGSTWQGSELLEGTQSATDLTGLNIMLFIKCWEIVEALNYSKDIMLYCIQIACKGLESVVFYLSASFIITHIHIYVKA